MANYIVDITVALKGSEKITRFNKQLQTTSKQIQAVNDLVKVQEALVGGLVKSFNNLSSNLAQAKSNFNAVASGTRLQEKAARQLIRAEKDLNKEYRERNTLLQRLRGTGAMPLPGSGVGSDPVAKSIARRRRKLMRGANQYSGAIGPGEAVSANLSSRLPPRSDVVLSSVLPPRSPLPPRSSIEPGQSLFGQSVNIEKSLRERMAVQDKLFQMEIGQTEAAKERTKQLNKQNTELRRMKVENQRSLYANTFTQYAGPIGPGMASPINPQATINERIEAQKRIQRRQDRLLRVRRGRDFQNRMGQARSNAIIGGAFPLLFGQGLGASAFGALGGFEGGRRGGQMGFALSLLGTVVGAQFDKLTQSARELGEALRNPIKNMDMLVTKMGQANTPFGDTVNTLKSLGLEAVAADRVLDNFNKTFGTNKTKLSQLGEESVRFTNELQKLGTGITLFVAGPLTFFLEKINRALGIQTVEGLRREAQSEAIKEARLQRNQANVPGGAKTGNPIIDFFKPGLDLFFEGKIRDDIDVQARSFEIFERKMNDLGLGGTEGTRDFQLIDMQRLIKERRDFELSTLNKQLQIEQKSLGFRSEDIKVLKQRMDLLKIVEKIKVKELVDTKIMTDEQKRAHEFEIDKLNIERQISEELLRQAIIMSDPMKAAIVDLNKEMAKLNDLRFQSVEFAKAFGSAFEDSFKGIIKGTMSVQEAFRNMFMRIADHFLDMAAQMVANSLSRGLIGMLGNLFNNPVSEVQGQSIYYAANGGPVGYKNPYIVGERGPELFVPNQSGNIIPNHDLAGIGGGSTNIVVNVDASGSNVQGDEEQGRELGRLISVAVQSEILQQQRPGGLLA